MKAEMSIPTITELPPPPSGKTGFPWTAASPIGSASLPDGTVLPRITVVTPSYNQAAFIEETLRSVLLQGYPNLEYIVMDGGSTDGSAEIIRKYEPWLSYARIGPDKGQSDAIAQGFARATGEILAWLNSDDTYLVGTLARVGAFFARHRNIVFAFGDAWNVDATGRMLNRLDTVWSNRFLTANLGVHGWIQPGSFWRRDAYVRAGGLDPSLHFCMDRDLYLRLLRVGPSARIAGPPLANFRTHADAKSTVLTDVGWREHALLLQRYALAQHEYLRPWLQLGWWLWIKPATLRIRLNRAFGWEL